MKFLIMAGGGGTRLWPLSRENNPKQFHRFIGPHSLLKTTFERLSSVSNTTENDIFVSTNEQFEDQVQTQLSIFKDHIICEPAKRDNAAALLLSLLKIEKLTENSQEIVGMFPSDHVITNTELFRQICTFAEELVQKFPEHIVTLGVRPTFPHTGLGYIEMTNEKLFENIQGNTAFSVARFVEKPNKEKAEEFLESFKYLWNTGMFFFRLDTVLKLYEKYLPDIFHPLRSIQDSFYTEKESENLQNVYPTLPKTSLDYGILEHIRDIIVVPVDQLGWSDIGNFKAIAEVQSTDEKKNIIMHDKAILKDSKNILLYGNKKPIACFGVEDLVIVETEDVTFITTKEKSEYMKDFIKTLEQEGYGNLL